MRPSDYPPPWSEAEAIAAPTDAEPIEVGVLVVGAGPAGLAAAIRLGQLVGRGSRDGGGARRGAGRGAREGQGARLAPALGRRGRSRIRCWRLLEGSRRRDLPTYGEVPGEAVLFLTRDRAVRLPMPPTMRNHGNVVVSLSQLGRCLAEVPRRAAR